MSRPISAVTRCTTSASRCCAAHDHEQFEMYCYSDCAVRGRRHRADSPRGGPLAATPARPTTSSWPRWSATTGSTFWSTWPATSAATACWSSLASRRPIQVTYIGYQNTTGMTAMDYRLTDERADPPGRSDAFHTEKLVRLPRSFFCYRPPDEAPPITPLPPAPAAMSRSARSTASARSRRR